MRYTRQIIVTKYNGIRYRSRLEARWAVFFDTLGIKFQYEPRVPRIAYLPDFFVAHQPRFPRSMYFEVKPAEYEPSDTIKPDSLAALHFPVGFLHSLRVPRAMHDGCEHEVFFGGSWNQSHGFCKCSCCGAIGFEFEVVQSASRVLAPSRRSTRTQLMSWSALTELPLATISVARPQRLTNRWSQPPAVAMRTFDFMKQFRVFATLAIASGGSAPSR